MTTHGPTISGVDTDQPISLYVGRGLAVIMLSLAILTLSVGQVAHAEGAVYLPLVTSIEQSLPNPPLFPIPVAGNWYGHTDQEGPVSFEVVDNDGDTTRIIVFSVQSDYIFDECEGWVETTITGSLPIVEGQFGYKGGNGFTLNGHFTSPTTAAGTFSYNHTDINTCEHLTQAGTWTAHSVGSQLSSAE